MSARMGRLLPAVALLALGTLGARTGHSQEIFAGKYPQQTGEDLFKNICQGCHMPDAKGATGAGTYPALAGNPRLVSAAYMAAVILHGRRDMPSFIQTGDAGPLENSKLSDAQIADVVNYVRTHFGNTYADRITARDVAGMH